MNGNSDVCVEGVGIPAPKHTSSLARQLGYDVMD